MSDKKALRESNKKAGSNAPSLSPHTKTEPIADGIDGKLYCSDCLKNAVRIDEDGSEYPNKKAYEESWAKYHPKKPSPSLSAKELSAKLKAGTPGWGLNNRKYYDGKNDYYGVRCAVLEEVIASLEAEGPAPVPTNQQQILESGLDTKALADEIYAIQKQVISHYDAVHPNWDQTVQGLNRAFNKVTAALEKHASSD